VTRESREKDAKGGKEEAAREVSGNSGEREKQV